VSFFFTSVAFDRHGFNARKRTRTISQTEIMPTLKILMVLVNKARSKLFAFVRIRNVFTCRCFRLIGVEFNVEHNRRQISFDRFERTCVVVVNVQIDFLLGSKGTYGKCGRSLFCKQRTLSTTFTVVRSAQTLLVIALVKVQRGRMRSASTDERRWRSRRLVRHANRAVLSQLRRGDASRRRVTGLLLREILLDSSRCFHCAPPSDRLSRCRNYLKTRPVRLVVQILLLNYQTYWFVGYWCCSIFQTHSILVRCSLFVGCFLFKFRCFKSDRLFYSITTFSFYFFTIIFFSKRNK
jgi:hypothetical protein